MSAPMNSQRFASSVAPILNESFDGIYELRKDEWKGVFKKQTAIPRAYHEEVMHSGFGGAPELPDGQAVTYTSGGELFVARYMPKVYGLAFAITKVLVEDGDHIRVGTTYAKHLANALVETKETIAANILNRSFNTNFKGGDGVELCSAAHPIVGGTFSNLLATAANLSQTSLEQILIQVRNAVDNNGKKSRLEAKKLIINPANMFQAEVILKSALKTNTANNDLNAIKSMGMLSEGQVQISRTTSTTAWWVQTDAPEGLKYMERRALTKSMEGDFDTDSMRYKATERYAMGWTDPRTVYGTPGV